MSGANNGPMIPAAAIVSRKETRVSPWVRLVEKEVRFAPGEPTHTYHCLAQADYIAIVAETPGGLIPLVSQYRPAVEGRTLELPAGLVDPGEALEECCRRELKEETGLTAQEIVYLGSTHPDTGRLANRQHSFYVKASDPDPAFVPEPGMTVEFVTREQLRDMIRSNQFRHQLHVAVVYRYELMK